MEKICMRDDLLHAKASVDWAKTKFPSLQERIVSWLAGNFDIVIEDTEAPATHNVIVAAPKEPLPLAFNVEVGAYINTIRSSLDILATTLSARNRVSDNPEAHFPIYRCLYDFIDPRGGLESIKWLPQTEREIIKSLKPYQGGNDLLWSLHYLDIMRKHRRLIDVNTRPSHLSISFIQSGNDFTPIATGWITVNEKAALGLIRKGASYRDMQFTADIAITEPCPVEQKLIIAALYDFASLAESIINLFDD
jgi:hypothetical protein